jgi:hypothetical protein
MFRVIPFYVVPQVPCILLLLDQLRSELIKYLIGLSPHADGKQNAEAGLLHTWTIYATSPPGAILNTIRTMALKFTTSYLEDSLEVFRYYKNLAERAMEQVTDDHLFAAPDEQTNSMAIIVKHMAGNMRSRWSGFLTSDGEKPDRNRDSEFIEPPSSRQELLRVWESGWRDTFSALEQLSDADLQRTVRIRGEAHSVTQAINRQIAHYAYHVGQIVMLAKHFAHDQWQSLSVPRNSSAEFNARITRGEASQR